MYHNFETKKALENWTTYEGCLISSRDPIEIFSEMLDKMLKMVVDKQHGSKDSKNGETTETVLSNIIAPVEGTNHLSNKKLSSKKLSTNVMTFRKLSFNKCT
ncbi:hypothetical protein QE152_g33971 [Popillia japonica]|uniref:Uncharacterized protein n=1 Tax=Popillia japonica TaxID=7064 RepID=A0AAW1IV83_POPJA